MNRKLYSGFDPSSPLLRKVLVVVAVAAIVPTPALAGNRCDTPNGSIEQRACAKAAEGADALRRFVERTRTIYALNYFDYARGEDPAVASSQPVRVVEAKTAP
jgi:hypothetical protein